VHAHRQGFAIRQEQPGCFWKPRKSRTVEADFVVEVGRDVEAVASGRDGRLKDVVQAQASPAAQRLVPAAYLSGGADAETAGEQGVPHDRLASRWIDEHVGAGHGWRCFATVECQHRARVGAIGQEEAASADARAERLDHAERG
jgi:hypothetical protein